ncbi:MAG: hypothetical protein A2103_02980 [Gammaproteobacteria bacterium GWF2_41_13]|nr:MAG: hypothetical protein A2103_02980 [Gammaproteobacteria bacterium GWF2_41_13]
MIKQQLVSRLNKKQHQLPEHVMTECVNEILNKMIAHLAEGGRIEIRDFGNFSLHYRPSRSAHNPKKGTKFKTNPKYAVHFKAGKNLKERVMKNTQSPIKKAGDSSYDHHEDQQ